MKLSLRVALVLSGVFLTVLSAVLAHFVINKNNVIIESMTVESAQIESGIDQAWQDAKSLGFRKDFAVILLSLSKLGDRETIQEYVKDVLKTSGLGGPSDQLIERIASQNMSNRQIYRLLADKVNENEKRAGNHIDSQYVKKLELEQKIADMKKRNSTLSAIALFLQIMGLMLVLAKDIVREKS